MTARTELSRESWWARENPRSAAETSDLTTFFAGDRAPTNPCTNQGSFEHDGFLRVRQGFGATGEARNRDFYRKRRTNRTEAGDGDQGVRVVATLHANCYGDTTRCDGIITQAGTLQTHPIVELDQQNVGRPIVERSAREVVPEVDAGIVWHITRATMRPHEEER